MESNRNKLIELLSSSNDKYVSGQLLSEKLNISRSAIWKHMRELEKDGYTIEGVSRKGYRIIHFPDKVSENTLQWGLHTSWIGKSIIHRESTSTTQEIAHQAARDGAANGAVVIADEQTKGKGRMNRQWHSSKGTGIWMSLILRPDIPPNLAPQLTLLTATVLADVFASYVNVQPKIKWPNDLLIHDKKTAGILTEMQAEQDQIQYVVIGIGINVNQETDEIPDDIKHKATSLAIESGQNSNIKDLIQQILMTFERAYDTYMTNGFQTVKQKWEHYGYRIGERLLIKTLRDEWYAKFIGIGEDGALLIQGNNNRIEQIYSAEIEWFEEAGDV
ncbi:biotin--[acetyl-CoA-carboxylase] ligase [Virgibacillus siamensis]|uniref:biotin--[acetyl-CoA-carboxylase] ligase n=1 Tax=Virgibacillus siamensis TaxID=480071 RepID=UPI000984506A|nr:biotin--[acetyl-CoA-carboxylase] ligase [Virgibacillus siamensis]